MRKFKSAMLALSILLSLVVVMGCQPIPQTKISTVSINFGNSTKALAAKGMSRAIVDGKLDPATDYFSFDTYTSTNGAEFWVSNSSGTTPGSQQPFSLTGATADGTGPNGDLIRIDVGGNLPGAALSATSLDIVTGSYDEALLQLAIGTKTDDNTKDIGPRFTVSSILYTGTAGNLYINGAAAPSVGNGYIYFAPKAAAGLDGPLFLTISFDPVSTDIEAARTTFLAAVSKAYADYNTAYNTANPLAAPNPATYSETYWSNFFNRFIEGKTDTIPKLGGYIMGNGVVVLEVIPTDKAFDFGSTGSAVTLNVSYDVTAATYAIDTSSRLNVTGTPPLAFTASVTQ